MIAASARALAASLVLFLALLASASSASAAVVINEIESSGAADFVELKNVDVASVDISGYVIKDNNDGNSFTVPGGTMLAANGYYVVDPEPGFGLGAADSARLFAPGNLVTPIDAYSWTEHAATTYGRCPDGTGAITTTTAPTRNAVNDCSAPVAASPWPGGASVALADGVGVFGGNLSGLAYQPSGTSVPGVLWAVRNGPSTLFRLVWDGAKWTPDTTNGWTTGKQLVYPGGGGIPDAEGVTLVNGDSANGVFVATERDDSNGGVSRPAILRYDVSGTTAAPLIATRDWNLTPDLPGLAPNAGPEAVTWVPDSALVAKGFRTQGGAVYDPAAFPNHGPGLFLAGIEQDGSIHAYALNQTNDTFTPVATFASGFATVMALEFEVEKGLLWAVCDDSCTGRSATLDVTQAAPNAGKFVVTSTFERPAGMANLNNEGFTITPQQECVGGFKPVIYADDGNTDSHALRQGTLNCTVLPAPAVTPTPTPTVTTTPIPTVTTTPTASPSPVDTTKPVLTKVSASRKLVKLTLSETAGVRITVQRRKGKAFKLVKAFTVAANAGANTIRFKNRIPAAKLKKGVLRIALVATDAAGNRSAPARAQVG